MGGIGLILTVFRSGSGDKSTAKSPSSPSLSKIPTSIQQLPKDPKVCLELMRNFGSYDEYSTTINGAIKNKLKSHSVQKRVLKKLCVHNPGSILASEVWINAGWVGGYDATDAKSDGGTVVGGGVGGLLCVGARGGI